MHPLNLESFLILPSILNFEFSSMSLYNFLTHFLVVKQCHLSTQSMQNFRSSLIILYHLGDTECMMFMKEGHPGYIRFWYINISQQDLTIIQHACLLHRRKLWNHIVDRLSLQSTKYNPNLVLVPEFHSIMESCRNIL